MDIKVSENTILNQIKDFPEVDKNNDLYPFKISVFIPRNIPPRDDYFRVWWPTDQALDFVERVHTPDAEFSSVEYVVFPENHMTQAEQQAFTLVISKHKNIHQIEEIMLITNSPLIVGSFRRNSIRILSKELS